MKKIPYGLQNLEKILDENYFYIDKTKYIENLENLDEQYIMFLRPRKFGKTLWIDTLGKYYDINYSDKFDKIFGELYIGKNPTSRKNSYYIIEFNFSGLSTENKDILKNGFKLEVYEKLKTFIEKYNLKIILDKAIEEPAVLLRNFKEEYERIGLERKIYVLIDEYDHFANELLSFKFNEFKNIVSKTGFVRKFYEVLKESTKTIVDRIFMTGIAPITLDSITSGFNIVKNLSIDREFNELTGFTEETVIELLKMYNIPANVLEDMKRSYNGYLFNLIGEKTVYNTDMVLYFLADYLRENRKPQKIIDVNIASDYKKMENMMRLSPKSQEIIDEIIENDGVTGELIDSFNMEREQKKDDAITLLFYLGYLTIKEETFKGIKLEIPNYVMRKLFYESFMSYIDREYKVYAETSDINKSIGELIEIGNINPLLKLVEKVLGELSNRDFINFDEKHLKAIMMAYLIKSPWYYIESEREMKKGYIDILVTRRYEKVPYEAMIELKYIKKKEWKDLSKDIGKIVEEGKEQLYRYLNDKKMQDRKNMKKFVILFVGDKLEKVVEFE
ncbi:AAA family ATPase [Haliovirga abyssi]|uniref:AAA-ATPase-like domain-containing protein n=1 Tax=Haliovirga abyssi TaxID=2996794 RepID=A0AAU9D5H5_9FUSO|nr:AAA family ATPase [Haliovirga abyssi]BDU51229.1 hypothetical protein HLVA_17980 [Haliovirga abyssi]